MTKIYEMDFIATHKLHRLTLFEQNHLLAWLRHRRSEEQHHQVLNRIMGALEYDPDLLEDHSWEEIESMGRELGL